MREFKPMVKMETTEPTVELKLKKGGAVKKMAQGGMPMGSAVGNPMGGMMPSAPPKKPSLAARRRAMMAKGAAGVPAGTAAGVMMAEGGASDVAQDKAMLKKAFKQHDVQEHPGGKGTKLKLATGGVAKSNAGGYATGGVVNGQGGFRKGGAVKKFAEGGRVQDDGGPQKMKQGNKPVPPPVSINQLSGTYKEGGEVSSGKSKSDPNKDFYRRMEEENKADAKSARDALMYIPRKIRDAGKSVVDAFKNEGSVTDTEREVSRTVTPAKKRGGLVC
jgi:hypothetical protein